MAAGLRVAEEREHLGFSQQELADRVSRLGYKISQTGIDKIEKRDTQRPKCLKELAAALGVTQEWLLNGADPKHPGSDLQMDEIKRDLRQLSDEEQEILFAQFRSLLDIARRKDLKRIK